MNILPSNDKTKNKLNLGRENPFMSSYDTFWLITLMPIMFLYGVVEIRRGWMILKHKKYSFNLAIQIRLRLICLLRGDEESQQYKEKLLNSPHNMRIRGIYSLLGGVLSIIVSLVWALLLFNLFAI